MWGPTGRVTAAVYKTLPIMPRRGATGDAGGAAGGKVRNRSINQQPRMPRELPAPRRLLISESRLLIAAAFIRGKKKFQSRRSHNFTFSLQRFLLDPPPVVRHLFEVNSEPHTGARPSVRLCVGLKSDHSKCSWNCRTKLFNRGIAIIL